MGEHWTPLVSGARTHLVRVLFCHVSSLAHSSKEWQLLDCALHAYGKVGVALYDTLGKDSVGEYVRIVQLYQTQT